MAQLSHEEVERFFEVHLPYRIGVLMAHSELGLCPSGSRQNACFTGSVVTARVLLNFLGIGKKGTALERYSSRHADDVSIEDLGGRPVEIDKLAPGDRDLILGFLQMADKATAHSTKERPHQWQSTDSALQLVFDLLRTHLYEPTGRRIPKIAAQRGVV